MTAMPDTDRLLAELVNAGALTPELRERARRLAAETGERADRVLIRLGQVSERAVADGFATLLGLNVAGVADYPAMPVCAELLSARFLRAVKVVPLALNEATLDLAMADPFDQAAAGDIGLATGCRPHVLVGLPSEIDAALDRLFGAADHAGGIQDLLTEISDGGEGDVDRLRDLASEAPIVRLVTQILTRAVDRRASDIHIEPFENDLRIRYRLDGQLVEQEPVPRRAAAAILSRVKLMAGLDIAERRLPQDGRVKLSVRGKDIDFRVATTPTLHGESAVLRILDRSGVTLEFTALGMALDSQQSLSRQLERNGGIILVTGPTGSGKTTTLYAALGRLNRTSRKIVTVEDPVEYQIHGINQIQVKPEIGLDFAGVLRSTLRHDPDIIMVGEIRDGDTARIAVQAALTGHLVLSTTHTNNAVATITRLIDLGISEFLIASTLNAVVAQRLVRRLCPDCRLPYHLPEQTAAEIGLTALAGGAEQALFRAQGCQACFGTGYRGRIGLFEVLEIDEARRAQILAHRSVAASAQSLWHDGLSKVLQGLTSLEEVTAVATPS
jgi:general secretion pathway protein E